MKIFTKKQIKEMMKLQKALDIRVRENNEIELDKDLTLEKFLALKTELYEFINELESFKYWKKNKGKDHILEEACDTLHFILSLAIDKEVDMNIEEKEIKELGEVDKIETNELLAMSDFLISDCMIDNDWIALKPVLTIMLIVLKRVGFDKEDLYNAYIEKNKVNHQRQDNNY